MEEKKNLSEEEKKRLERFEQISGEMTAKGYTRKDLTVDIGKAKTFGLFLIIPLAVIFRYFPVLAGEYRRITLALRQRGIKKITQRFVPLIVNNINGIENEEIIGNYNEDVIMMMYDDVVIINKEDLAK